MPEISVLVPVCNVELYLEQCLESILAQSFPDLEILCIDDGSADASGRILDAYAEKDRRIRVIHKPNSGYGHTMNLALSLASGRYVGIVESDDWILPDMYRVMHEAAVKFRLDFVKTDFYKIWDGRSLYCPLSKEKDLYGCVLCPNEDLRAYHAEKFIWNALYKREFLLKHGIRFQETPGASFQDNGFWFQTFYHAGRMMFLDQAYYRYRQDNPGSSVLKNDKMYAMKQEYDFIRDFLIRQKETRRHFFRICFHYRLSGYLFTLYMLADDKKEAFADIIRRECALYESLGEADYSRFSEAELRAIRNVKRGYPNI